MTFTDYNGSGGAIGDRSARSVGKCECRGNDSRTFANAIGFGGNAAGRCGSNGIVSEPVCRRGKRPTSAGCGSRGKRCCGGIRCSGSNGGVSRGICRWALSTCLGGGKRDDLWSWVVVGLAAVGALEFLKVALLVIVLTMGFATYDSSRSRRVVVSRTGLVNG